MHDVTVILKMVDEGGASIDDDLFPLIYEELKRIAQLRLQNEAVGHTLQATALVNEYYMKLARLDSEAVAWSSRRHFFQAAAKAMQRILVDHARGKKRLKRGGGQHNLSLDQDPVDSGTDDVDLIELDDALKTLERESPRAAEVVRLKYFANLTIKEVAESLDISAATVEREWAYAKAWLRLALQS